MNHLRILELHLIFTFLTLTVNYICSVKQKPLLDMKENKLTKMHLAVINELKKGHLTSFQILKRIQGVSLILVVYNILDELKRMGILKSYMKQDMKYHYIVNE